MKCLFAALIASLVFSTGFGSIARAGSACLTQEEQSEYAIIKDDLAKAIAERPDCVNYWGAMACTSPFSDVIRRNLERKLTECAIEGAWDVVARVCETSGSPAQDKFVIGRDRMTLVFTNGLAQFDTVIAGAHDRKVYQMDIYGKIAALRLVKSTSTGMAKTAQMGIELTTHPTLVITTSGFGPAGSCAAGEVLKTYFRKP